MIEVLDPIARMERVASHLKRARYRFSTEVILQASIADVLTAAGVSFEREARLSNGERVDFLVGGDLAVEVKIKGAFVAVAEQLGRYAAIERVSAVLLVTARRQLLGMPTTLYGKPVRAALIAGAFG